MAFSQLSQLISGGMSSNNHTEGDDGPQQQQSGAMGLDSITLGQLKAMVGSAPKPKQFFYDFRYDDEDTVLNEIEEFYSYVEMPQVAENLKAWEGCFSGEWVKAPFSQRRAHVEKLLEGLEHRDAIIRFLNARRLLYVLQGTFAETTSPEHQLHWIFENGKAVRAADGMSSVVEAMKIANSRHDFLSSLSDADAAHFNISAQDKADLLEEVNTEISVYLGMMYHLIEVFKGHDEFADELMTLDPPLPVYLFNVVSGLRDKSAKGYPIKKLLLVLWKTLLACCGGIRELDRVKKLARDLSGLPPLAEEAMPVKSTPMDVDVFHKEAFVKYPTFSPRNEPPLVPNTPITTSRLAEAYSPIPVRHHYHHGEVDAHGSVLPGAPGLAFHPSQGAGSAFRPGVPQPATPAPSPPPAPPSPKPTKKQYQTDQNRPFLFPFSKGTTRMYGTRDKRDGQMVPFAIDEAEKLYARHMYVSLSLWQMWRTREECMTHESGLKFMPGSEGVLDDPTPDTQDEESAEPLPDVALLDRRITEAEAALAKAQSPAEKRKAKELKEDLMRLKRVEQIYSSVLPVLSGWVLVLLKLLLATVSAATAGQPPSAAGFPQDIAPEQPPAPPPTLDEIDVTRHREITSKAVSAILLLTLKWFKVSHVMKFHHLGQLLLDTNCLLLILKMFGLQEVSISVVSKADSPENNFFRYCQYNFSKAPPSSFHEQFQPTRNTATRTTILPNGQRQEEEIELLTDFSWRNFFATINFAKIMQKLSKHRSHRIWMLVQYKSSAVLKRVLRVSHPMLQLHTLKLIKSQVPFCGRKWRQSNMKVITSIYLNCRPDLRDEWLTGTEVDDASDAQAQEQALRHLVKFYNNKRYGTTAAQVQHPGGHRRTGSVSQHIEGLLPGPELPMVRPLGTPNIVEADVFPPVRAQVQDPNAHFLPYIAEDLAFEEEYEEYLNDLGIGDAHTAMTAADGSQQSLSAWHRLPAYASQVADGISDSESVVSIGELGEDASLNVSTDEDAKAVDENVNNWAQMSPKTMAALSQSPSGPRRSSSGTGLRPVLPLNLDDPEGGNVVEEAVVDEEEELGPIIKSPGTYASGEGVDEVEYVYGI